MATGLYQDSKGNRFKSTPETAEKMGWQPVDQEGGYVVQSKAADPAENKMVPGAENKSADVTNSEEPAPKPSAGKK